MKRARRVAAAAGLVTASALVLPGAALAHGDEVPVSELRGAWHLEPVVLAIALLGLALFAQAFVRLRRRGRSDYASRGRGALFVIAVVLAVLALMSPLDAIGEEYLLSGHMLQHVVIGDAVPALLVVALRGPILFFCLPALVLGPLARSRRVRAVLRFLFRPQVALPVWLLAIGSWHVPSAYESVLRSSLLHDLEHTSFVLAGLLVWVQLVDPARRGALTWGRRLALALILFTAAQTLANVLVFSQRSLYPAYAAQDERLFGLSPLSDQATAGLVMMAEMALTLGVWTAYQLLSHFRAPLALPREVERHPLAL